MNKIRFLGPALVVLLLAGAAPSAFAQQDQSFSGPVDKRIDRLEKQLHEVRVIVLQAHATGAPVEIKESGPDPQVVALTSRLDDMDQTLRGVNGQFESLQHDLAGARKDAAQANAQVAALSVRLDTLEKQVAALSPAPPNGPEGQAGSDGGLAGQTPAAPVDPKAAFANAYQLLRGGDNQAAGAAFQDYVDRFGDTPDVAPARYYLGETKYLRKDYTGAAAAYSGAIHGWPQTVWAPDAVVKLSLSLAQLGRTKDACGALAEFNHRYPNASPAAKDRADAARQRVGCRG